jgi:ribonuclease Z
MELWFFGTSGAISTAEDGNVSFAVSADAAALLVDLSGNPVQNLMRCKIDPLTLDAVVLTHAHPDHLYALPSLIQSLWLMKREKPLALLSNLETVRKAQDLLRLFGLLDKEEGCELIWRVESDVPLGIAASVNARLFPVDHSIPTSGVRIESTNAAVVYSADCAPSPRILEAAAGCRALIHESSGPVSRAEQLNSAGHSAGAQAGEIAAQAGVSTLFLCHFDRWGDSTPEDMKSEAQRSYSGTVVIPELYRKYRI